MNTKNYELLVTKKNHRTQFVNINGTLSTEEYITSGLPHTAFSPLLFHIHIYDITLLLLNGKLVCYEDNTVLIVLGDIWEEVFHTIQTDINCIRLWLLYNSAFLNIQKNFYFITLSHYQRFFKN